MTALDCPNSYWSWASVRRLVFSGMGHRVRADLVARRQQAVVVGLRVGPVGAGPVGAVADVDVVGADEVVGRLPLVEDRQQLVVDAGAAVLGTDQVELHRLVEVVAGGEEGRLPAHLQLQGRLPGVARGPVQRVRQHVVVGEQAFGGEVHVPAADLGGEDGVVGLAADDLVGEDGGARDDGGEPLGADRGVVADRLPRGVAFHDGVGDIMRGDVDGGRGGSRPAFQLDAEQRLHAGIGVARQRRAVLVVGHEVAGGDQADAVVLGGGGEGVLDGGELGGRHIGEGGEDQGVVVGELGEVGEVVLGQDVEGHAGHRGLVLRRHEELRVGRLVEELGGAGLGIDDPDLEAGIGARRQRAGVDHLVGGQGVVLGEEDAVVDVGVDVGDRRGGREAEGAQREPELDRLQVRRERVIGDGGGESLRGGLGVEGRGAGVEVRRRRAGAAGDEGDVEVGAGVQPVEDRVAGRGVVVGVQPQGGVEADVDRALESEDESVAVDRAVDIIAGRAVAGGVEAGRQLPLARVKHAVDDVCHATAPSMISFGRSSNRRRRNSRLKGPLTHENFNDLEMTGTAALRRRPQPTAGSAEVLVPT